MKNTTQQLLVEGKDDQNVIWALCGKFDLKQNFKVEDSQGIEKLISQISVRLKQASIHTLGIVVDADTQLQSRWQSIKTEFAKENIILPNSISESGFIQDFEEIRIGIWIMPNNKTDGMVEDFIQFLIPKDDKLLPFVDKHLEEIEKQGLNRYSETHKSKTRIHAWLALQEKYTPMGQAITVNYLTTDEENCQLFVDWLKELFRA
ncbi:DUF3226 domain-containing protein [Bernardetia sp. MNP-M8]|uniref:DUF3226 domain-containing protein n=1 Tax=Bernardetia sp. MNP-M8 TaxID=3127470 RepID=UPI0030CF61C8